MGITDYLSRSPREMPPETTEDEGELAIAILKELNTPKNSLILEQTIEDGSGEQTSRRQREISQTLGRHRPVN